MVCVLGNTHVYVRVCRVTVLATHQGAATGRGLQAAGLWGEEGVRVRVLVTVVDVAWQGLQAVGVCVYVCISHCCQ